MSEKNAEMDKSKGSVFPKCEDPHANMQAFPQQMPGFSKEYNYQVKGKGERCTRTLMTLDRLSVGLYRFV